MKKFKVKVYIDGANMFYTQKDLGWIFDWKKVKKLTKDKFSVDEFIYYTPLRREKEKQVRQIERIKKWGFKIRTKPPKLIKRKFKANFDVEISIDILLEIIDGWKEDFVIFSGDSDFAYLTNILHKRFKRKIFIFSSKKFLSWELAYLADSYFYLEDFKKQIFLKKWLLTKGKKNVKKKIR
jgi:uncharacterized LabA/DUF88 family protein